MYEILNELMMFLFISEQNIMQAIVAGREAKVKRRKCRTAFTNFQLSVLEQRFNCHKYLTPTDRDQIANILGLSPPQVNKTLGKYCSYKSGY